MLVVHYQLFADGIQTLRRPVVERVQLKSLRRARGIEDQRTLRSLQGRWAALEYWVCFEGSGCLQGANVGILGAPQGQQRTVLQSAQAPRSLLMPALHVELEHTLWWCIWRLKLDCRNVVPQLDPAATAWMPSVVFL